MASLDTDVTRAVLVACPRDVNHGDMSSRQRVRRGVAAVSSGALVVGAGAAVGVLSAQMADEWSRQAAIQAASGSVAQPADVAAPRPTVVTRIKIRRVTPDPVIVRKKAIVRESESESHSAERAPGSSSGTTVPPRTSSPSRTVISPAPRPAAPKPVPKPAAGKPKPTATTSTTS